MLLLASLQHSDYYATLSESELGGLKLHRSPQPHHQQMMESNVALAVVLIGLDRHVGGCCGVALGRIFVTWCTM